MLNVWVAWAPPWLRLCVQVIKPHLLGLFETTIMRGGDGVCMTERHQPTIFKEQRRSRTSSISIIGSTVGIFWDLGGKNTFDRALRRFFSDTRPPGRIWFSLYANLACRYKEAS